MAALLSYDDIIATNKQKLVIYKTAATTSVANQPQSIIAGAGAPGSGSLVVGNTANGIIPTDATGGAPVINAFTGTSIGYILKAFIYNSVTGIVMVYDRIFSCGSYNMGTTTATTTLSAQPSYTSRVPNSDFTKLELWLETGGTALSNHAHSVSVSYLDEGSNVSSTPNLSTQNLISGRMSRFALQAGDKGIIRIESVTANGVASGSGSFNIHVMRPLIKARINQANGAIMQGPELTFLSEIYDTSNLFVVVQPDSTSAGLPYIELTVGSKAD